MDLAIYPQTPTPTIIASSITHERGEDRHETRPGAIDFRGSSGR
jgi:hypothetical protein